MVKALGLVAPRRIEVIEQPEPQCGPHDVVVRMRALGLCGSDLSVFDGRTSVPEQPWVLGHEGGGEIVAVGDAVTDRAVGEVVVIEPNLCCLSCRHCRAGNTSACTRRRSLGINAPGIAAEFIAVPAAFVWPVAEGTSPQTLACFEPYVVTKTAARRAGIRPGQECLIVGAGSQGLLLCVHLLGMGAVPYLTEIHEGRQNLAERLGALRAPTAPARTYPLVFETSGSPAAFTGALAAVDRLGRLILIGQSATPVVLSTRDLVQRQITVIGSLIYDHPADFQSTATSVAAEEERLKCIVQAGFPPSQATAAFDEAGKVAGKTWIDLSAW